MSNSSGIDPVKLMQMTEQRNFKNRASRSRAQSRRTEIQTIESRPSDQRNQEECLVLAAHEAQRVRKNRRSRERMVELRTEVYRILAKPAEERSTHESNYVDSVLRRNMRKNEGDRLRRLRKKLGDQQDLKLPPLSRRKGPAFTTAHLQMNKIYKEYNRCNKDLKGDNPAFEEQCKDPHQHQMDSSIRDLPMACIAQPHQQEGQSNMESNVDASSMGLMEQGAEDCMRNSVAGTSDQRFCDPWGHHQSPSFLSQVDLKIGRAHV